MSQYVDNLNQNSDSWAISTDDYEKYSTNFKSYTKNGWLEAGVARDIFTQSNLAPHLLYQVWNLADSEKLGKLNEERFIVAMHLIFKKLGGIPLPLDLPKELKPGNVLRFKNDTFNLHNTSHSGLSSPLSQSFSPIPSTASSQIQILEAERDRKQQQVNSLLNSNTSRYESESNMKLLKKEVETFIDKSSIPKNLFKENTFIKEKINQPTNDKLENLILNIKSIKEVDLENLVRKSKELNKKMLESEIELFSLEDAKLYGYTIPGQSPGFSPISVSNGSDPISQKAAAMLNQRLQALNMSSAGKEIPDSAKLRIEEKKLELQSKQQRNDEAAEKMGKEIKLLLAQADQLVFNSIPNRVYSLKELSDHYNRWQNAFNSSSEIGSLLKHLFNNDSKLNDDKSSFIKLPEIDITSTTPAPVKIDNKPNFNFQQSNHSDTFDTEDRDSQPKTPDDPSVSLNSDNMSEKSQIALASRQAREKARLFEKNNLKDIPARPLSPKPSYNSFRTKPKISKPEVKEHFKPIKEQPSTPTYKRESGLTTVPKPVPKPNVNEDKQPDDEHPQEAIGVGAIRAAARLARQKALENIASNDTIASSRPAPPPVKAKPSHLSKKPSFQQQINKPNPFKDEKKETIPTHEELKPTPKVKEAAPEKAIASDKFPKAESESLDVEKESGLVDFRAALKSTKSKKESFYKNTVDKKIEEESYNDNVATEYPVSAEVAPPVESSQSEENIFTDSQSTIMFKVPALYDYNDDEDSSTNVVKLKAGDMVVVTSIPEDNPGWCLGYSENLGASYTGWIPSAYLDLPNQENHDITEVHVESISPEIEDEEVIAQEDSSGAYVRLTEEFEAAVDGGTVIFSCDYIIELVDQSNPDWFLAKHPDTGDLAYLPSDQLYLVDQNGEYLANNDPTNPFARNQAAQSAYKSQTSSTHDLNYNGQMDMDLMSSPHRKGWASQMDAETLATLSPTEIKRKESMFELVATEKTYLRDMQLVLELFYQPLQSVLDPKDMRAIFSNLDELVVLNTTFLSDIELAANDQDPQGRGIGDIFLEHIDSFQNYAEYCGNQAAASRQLNSLYSDARISELLQTASAQPECRMLTLNSFLLEPVQRITRYPLLLRQIHKYTPTDHPSYHKLEEAFTKAEAMLKNINASAQLNENTQRLKELANRIDLPPGFDLLASTRNLGPRQCIIDGPLNKHKSSRTLHGFLFNDLFLITEVTNPNSPQPRYSLYRPPIPLLRLQVRDAQTSQGRRGIFSPYDDACFQVVHVKDILTLRAATASTKKKWMNELTKAIAYAKTGENYR